MAEPARTSPPAATAAERDVLLATKLHIPRPRRGFLARSRLVDRLTDGLTSELTLVCAPAGFGKTTLLADWARRSQTPVAWLSLDGDDNDPIRFWRYVAAALDRVSPGVGEQVAALLRDPQTPPEAVVTVVVNALAARPGGLGLVLDDVHLVEAAPVHNSLALLLDRLPPQVHVVLATRVDPALPLARLRARGQLAELRAVDLRFTPEEATALLQEAMGLELPASSAAALVARTEGWAAGLQLAGLSLRGHRDPAGFVAGFSGSHRYVLDYLTEEVLERQPEPLVEFLLATSVLERLSGPLCDAVTGRHNSQRLLEAIERAGLFLVPLDAVRGWWRYHQLFADLLQARLQQAQPDRVPGLHRAAAGWCEEHGLADQAVRHALATGDDPWAARLVERNVEALIGRSELATVDRWLAALPARLVRARPRLLLAQASVPYAEGRLEAVESLLEDAERALATAAGEEPYEPSVGREASLFANVPATIALLRADLARQRGDPERTATFARQGLATLTEADRALRSVLAWDLAMADWQLGRLAAAERALAAVAAERLLASVHAWYDLGQIQQAQGHLDATQASYQQLLEIAGKAEHPSAALAHEGMAEVLYERDELDAALGHATQAVALCRQDVYVPARVAALTILARIRQAQGDQAGALAAIGEAEQVTPSPNAAPDLSSLVGSQRARLALAHGKVADAARWVQARGLGAEEEPRYPREREYLVLARLLLAEGAPQRALGLLERWTALAVTQGRIGSVIELRALQALAHAACGDEPAALAALDEAVALGAPEGYLRVFVDEGPPMAALFRPLLVGRRLEQLVADGAVPREYLSGLVAAFEQAGAPIFPARRGTVVVPGLVEPLSARELEVLKLMAAGEPNRAIAEELVVTLDTVKSHVAHILSKLGVANRTQAVARARELGLLR